MIMSQKTKEVYNFIVQYTKTHLYPPSYEDIKNGTSLKSKSTVSEHIDIFFGLTCLGVLIVVESKKPRTIRLRGYELRKITQ